MQHPASKIFIFRQRQLLMRVLRLWVVIDDKNVFDLIEEKPLMIEVDHLPIKITANNGYHSSKPFYIRKPIIAPLYIEIGCTADNGLLWGGILLSILFFILFFATEFLFFLVFANFPLFYLVYRFFIKHKEFITVSVLKIDNQKNTNKNQQ